MKHFLFIVTFTFSSGLFGQNPNIIRLYSENREYVLKTIPFSFQTDDTLGKTEVMRASDSVIIYSFDRSLANSLFFLSNDGKSILEFGLQLGLSFYQLGKKMNHSSLKDYHQFGYDNCKSNLLFQAKPEKSEKQYQIEIDSIANQIPVFAHNDTLYFITCTDSVLTFSLTDGHFIGAWPMYDPNLHIAAIANKQSIDAQELNAPNWGIFPPLADGSNFETNLAQYLGMTFDKPKKRDLKYYNLSLRCLINSDGHCEEVKPVFELHSKEDSIRQFVSGLRFDVSAFPKELDKWVFHDFLIYLRKSDAIVAHQEFESEKVDNEERYNQNLVADTINNIYIPKDLNDCYRQLDLILTQEKKEDILKNGPDAEHFVLGQWIRNSWGLWGGSRLLVYLKSKELTNPEDMSEYILDGYFKHLKEKKKK